MCRHLAYVGPAVPAAVALLDAPHALLRQVRTPRHQLAGVTNEDGWGMAWWEGSSLHQHRSTMPFADDHDGHALVRAVTAGSCIAAVRRATPGSALVEPGNAPFVADGLGFSLNGFVGGFYSGAAGRALRAAMGRHHDVAGDTDGEVLFALVRDRLDAGSDAPTALQAVVDRALDAAGEAPSRLNLLLTDGATIWATRRSNSLFTRRHVDGSAAVASEPWDDDAAWYEVPDGSTVTVSPVAVDIDDLR
jgi:glutamine amidotransferase